MSCEHIIKYYAASGSSSLCKLMTKKWKLLKELVHILKIPYDVTIASQSKKLTLSDVYGRWLGMQLHFQACIDKKFFKSGLEAAKTRSFMQQKLEVEIYLKTR